MTVLRVAAVVLWCALASVGAVFIALADTWRGRCLTLGIALLGTAALLVLLRCRRWGKLCGVGLGLGLALAVPVAATTPGGAAGAGSLRVEHQFTRPGAAFPRFAFSNMIPEADQVALGLGLARWVDPYLDARQAGRVRRLSLPLYEAMSDDPALADAGSVMTWAYDEVLGREFDRGHYVALVPAEPRATLVFLHGSGGNFASYWYVLAELARRHRVAVICPSFGLGNWQRPGGVEAVFRALDHATGRYNLDRRRIYLAALSNGGRGATRVMLHRGGRRFRGVVFLSAVLEAGPLGRGMRSGAWRGKRVLVIHGTRDRRIPWGHVRVRLDLLRAGGARLQVRAVRGEDHFLFFSRREQVIARIARWTGGR